MIPMNFFIKEKAPERVLLVRMKGLEPTRYCYHWNLNPARLPIPPHPQGWIQYKKYRTL